MVIEARNASVEQENIAFQLGRCGGKCIFIATQAVKVRLQFIGNRFCTAGGICILLKIVILVCLATGAEQRPQEIHHTPLDDMEQFQVSPSFY